MEPWHIWTIAALACIILEIFTPGFAVACFSIGAAGAAVSCAFGTSTLWQFIIFAVISLAALVFVRPFVVKLFYKTESEQTNADALIGRRGRVSEAIDPVEGKGRVAIDGDEWKAVPDNGCRIEKGEWVEIISRESLIVTVKKI